jgi:hypothetical protein
MRAEFFSSWPAMSPEAMLTVTHHQQKPRMISLLPPPSPPDEKTVRRLNALASNPPFCKHHRVRKHDTL